MGRIDLYDRVVNVKLIRADGGFIEIKTPKTGPKPSITVSGSFVANIIYDATLQMTNFYTPTDLLTKSGQSAYKWVEITCGYKSSLMTPITGQILTAYQDKPSPDGVTTFTFFTGFIDDWTTKVITLDEKEGTTLNTVVDHICSQLSARTPIAKQSYVEDTIVLTAPVQDQGTLADVCLHLGRAYGVCILPEGKALRVVYSGVGEHKLYPVHELLYYSDVKKTATTLTVTAPFDPAIRPNDYVRIDPKYFSSDLSGMYANYGNKFMLLNEHFTFGTTDGGNRMVLTLIGQPKQASESKYKARNRGQTDKFFFNPI